jgi:hypothetical protein
LASNLNIFAESNEGVIIGTREQGKCFDEKPKAKYLVSVMWRLLTWILAPQLVLYSFFLPPGWEVPYKDKDSLLNVPSPQFIQATVPKPYTAQTKKDCLARFKLFVNIFTL